MKLEPADVHPKTWVYCLVIALILLGLPGSVTLTAAQADDYQLILAARPSYVCALPRQEVEIRAVVVRMSPNRPRRIPNIGITAEIASAKLGTIHPSSSIASGPLRLARFIYTPSREGEENLVFHAIGRDQATGKTIQLINSISIFVRPCFYEISIRGYMSTNQNTTREFIVGAGKARVNDDHSINGEGGVLMGQEWGLPRQICQNQRVQKKFPFVITGNYSSNGTVNFKLEFKSTPIPQQSQKLKCDTGAGSSASFLIPLWPVTPNYLPINEFEVGLSGGSIHWPYPMQGESGDIMVRVVLVQER